jgi:hypothetical protein
MKVKYTGTSDFQEFGAEDFKKADVNNQKKVVFAKGEPTEVSPQAGKALLSDEGLFGPYAFEEVEEKEEAVDEVSGPDSFAGDADSQTESGSLSTGDSTPGETGDTGRGTSTGRARGQVTPPA